MVGLKMKTSLFLSPTLINPLSWRIIGAHLAPSIKLLCHGSIGASLGQEQQRNEQEALNRRSPRTLSLNHAPFHACSLGGTKRHDVMWPLCVISDKFAKMIGDGEEKQECDPDNSIPLSCRAYHVDVPHVRQMFNWDCGLACVLMVLRTLGIDSYDITDLEDLCSTTSIWTVDLAYLLHKFSVNFSFLTVTVGVNPSYSAQSFYQEQLEDDTGRVIDLFAKAIHAGISIQCRTISVHDISVLLLSGRCIAVALVDKTKLVSSWIDDGTGNYLNGTSEYTGHYIVICGFDAGTNEFEIRDPACSRKYERVTMECLDEARKSFGTDEDILLVSLDGTDGSKLSPSPLVY